jgi:hypothetical protein
LYQEKSGTPARLLGTYVLRDCKSIRGLFSVAEAGMKECVKYLVASHGFLKSRHEKFKRFRSGLGKAFFLDTEKS